MAQNMGTFCADELKRCLRLEDVIPRFLRAPQQLGKLNHGEKILLLPHVSGGWKRKVSHHPFKSFLRQKKKILVFVVSLY